jgi:hypothetical protein
MPTKACDLRNVLIVHWTWRREPGGNGDVVKTPANAFCDRLNQILAEHKFDAKVERSCQKFYKRALAVGQALHGISNGGLLWCGFGVPRI